MFESPVCNGIIPRCGWVVTGVFLARFEDAVWGSGLTGYGLVAGNTVKALARNPFADPDPISSVISPELAGERPLEAVRLLAPVRPSKIVGVGLNYATHAREFGWQPPAEPLIFLKPPSAVIGPGEPILCPPESGQVEFEGELVLVIGRRARRISVTEACAVILGYTCGNDVTARDIQRADGQWTRAKGFDTFAPLGPWIAVGVDASDLLVTTRVNGITRQDDRTSSLIFTVPELVSFISHVMTLEPGDVIFTGTPSGTGAIRPGDVVEVEIEGIGCLKNTVRGM